MRAQQREFSAVMALPVAALGIHADDSWLHQIVYLPPGMPVQTADTGVAAEVAAQINAYLRDASYAFDLPIAPSPTEFQQTVRHALQAIPIGSSLTYGQMAAALRSSARAVGGACRRNPVPLVVPCHRVVAAGGVGGFAGQTSGWKIRLKRWLLRHEGYFV
jgi:methylated-DNA-[protein]-cysteine S-methyltransferase